MSDSDPIIFRPRAADGARTGNRSTSSHSAVHGPYGGGSTNSTVSTTAASSGDYAQHAPQVAFNRQELTAILAVYGRKVALGEWRDYALDLTRDKAVFSVFRRACEVPLYRIEKDPKLARRQGAYTVVAAGGLILKRGHDLARVLGVFDKSQVYDVVGR